MFPASLCDCLNRIVATADPVVIQKYNYKIPATSLRTADAAQLPVSPPKTKALHELSHSHFQTLTREKRSFRGRGDVPCNEVAFILRIPSTRI